MPSTPRTRVSRRGFETDMAKSGGRARAGGTERADPPRAPRVRSHRVTVRVSRDAVPGGAAAPKPTKAMTTETAITLGKFVDDFVSELELHYYALPVGPAVTGLKIVLIPINGDADLFVSFETAKPERRTATCGTPPPYA